MTRKRAPYVTWHDYFRERNLFWEAHIETVAAPSNWLLSGLTCSLKRIYIAYIYVYPCDEYETKKKVSSRSAAILGRDVAAENHRGGVRNLFRLRHRSLCNTISLSFVMLYIRIGLLLPKENLFQRCCDVITVTPTLDLLETPTTSGNPQKVSGKIL